MTCTTLSKVQSTTHSSLTQRPSLNSTVALFFNNPHKRLHNSPGPFIFSKDHKIAAWHAAPLTAGYTHKMIFFFYETSVSHVRCEISFERRWRAGTLIVLRIQHQINCSLQERFLSIKTGFWVIFLFSCFFSKNIKLSNLMKYIINIVVLVLVPTDSLVTPHTRIWALWLMPQPHIQKEGTVLFNLTHILV